MKNHQTTIFDIAKALGISKSTVSRALTSHLSVHASTREKVLKFAGEMSYETEVANAKVMLAYQVDGLLVSMTKETKNVDHLKIFQRKGIPIVFFNRVCDEIDPPLTTVEQPIREMCRTAADLLFKQLALPVAEWKAPTVVLKTKLLIRRSS
jgi:DNA-binding LacI/PurR family transcriptional regulator